ncbi:MAG: hypothetical protein HY698_11185 [Deltaproteobacteria bacterium]|nr:hypothetical protein [Deltaproteobacteria bacterium]
MWIRAAALVLAAWIWGCGSAASGPEAAFDRLHLAMATRDARVLFDVLETESRWAVDTVWKYQRELAALLVKDFPAHISERELKRLKVAVDSASSREFFAAQNMLGDPLAELGHNAEGLGTRARVERDSPEAKKARVITTTGRVVPVACGPDGMWGYSGLHDDLLRWREATANDLSRFKQEADLFSRGK